MIRSILCSTVLVLASSTTMVEARGLSVDWSDRAAWNCAHTVAIRTFAIRPNSTRIPSENAATYFASGLSALMTRRSGIEKVFVTQSEEPVEADVILTGTFLDLGVEQRPRGLSFGAPTSICNVSIRAFRSDGMTPVFTVEASREIRLDEGDETGVASMDAVAHEIAQELVHNRHACVASEVRPLQPALTAQTPPIPATAPVVAPTPVAPSPAPAVVPAASIAPAAAVAVAPAVPPTLAPTVTPAAPPVTPVPPQNHAEMGENATTSIESNVPNADVFIDGKFAGNAPIATYMLTPGSHVIEVKAVGFADWSRELNVTRGTATRVVASLVSR